MSEGKLTVEKRGAVGWIIFDHTARRNAINGAMWRGIPAAMERFEKDSEVRRGRRHLGVRKGALGARCRGGV